MITATISEMKRIDSEIKAVKVKEEKIYKAKLDHDLCKGKLELLEEQSYLAKEDNDAKLEVVNRLGDATAAMRESANARSSVAY